MGRIHDYPEGMLVRELPDTVHADHEPADVNRHYPDDLLPHRLLFVSPLAIIKVEMERLGVNINKHRLGVHVPDHFRCRGKSHRGNQDRLVASEVQCFEREVKGGRA